MLSLVAKFTFAQTATPALVDSIVNANTANAISQLNKLTYYTTNATTVTNLVTNANTALLLQLNALNYSVPVKAPVITYSSISGVVGTAITPLLPTNTGDAALSYSISPALPAGLTLNSLTGGISGTPTVALSPTVYIITAINSAGSSTSKLTITITSSVVVTPPPSNTYVSSKPVTYSGKSNFNISGLLIDASNAKTTLITLTNCSNVHITKCKLVNTTNFAINLTNCTNVVVDSCFITNVGFGVIVNSGTGIKINSNQMLNINGIDSAYFGHAVQFIGVSGGGNQINYNRVENIAGVAKHPHDVVSVYKSNGIRGDSIQVIGNWFRGGQTSLWPTAYSGACGITIADVSGSYQVVRGNILVNTGYAGIQCIGTGGVIKIDHNTVFSTNTPVSLLGFSIQDKNQIECSYNVCNWMNSKGVTKPDGSGVPQYWLSSSPTPIGWSTNKWQAPITANILPATIITMK